jgi:hypothetical protein
MYVYEPDSMSSVSRPAPPWKTGGDARAAATTKRSSPVPVSAWALSTSIRFRLPAAEPLSKVRVPGSMRIESSPWVPMTLMVSAPGPPSKLMPAGPTGSPLTRSTVRESSPNPAEMTSGRGEATGLTKVGWEVVGTSLKICTFSPAGSRRTVKLLFPSVPEGGAPLPKVTSSDEPPVTSEVFTVRVWPSAVVTVTW